jgi:hypothetical protein
MKLIDYGNQTKTLMAALTPEQKKKFADEAALLN